MYEPSSEILQMAADAAEKLIGFYPSIQASDPKIYAAGLVQLFSRYPEYLIAEAVDPVDGLPSLHDFPPTMKQVKQFLEPRLQNHLRQHEAEARRKQARLAAPAPNPEVNERIKQGFEQLQDRLRNGPRQIGEFVSGIAPDPT